MAKTPKIRQLEASFDGSFEDIYSVYFKPLYLFARSIAKSDDLAKDAVSEVFFNLWKSKTDLSQIRELKPYLFRSVKNYVIREISNDPGSFSSIDTENLVKHIEKVSPEEVLLEKELVKVIEEAISKLPDQCKLIYGMAKDENLKYHEIATRLGVSQSTIKTQVARAVAVIKKAIEENYHDRNGGSGDNYMLGSAVLAVIFSADLILDWFSNDFHGTSGPTLF